MRSLLQEVYYEKFITKSLLQEVYYKKFIMRSLLQEVYYEKFITRSLFQEVYYRKLNKRSFYFISTYIILFQVDLHQADANHTFREPTNLDRCPARAVQVPIKPMYSSRSTGNN